MGSATTICSDKTGTLTLNQMTVVECYVGKKKINPPEDRSQLHVEVSTLLNEGIAHDTLGSVFSSKDGGGIEVSGSPTEKAILYWGVKSGMKFDLVRSECTLLHVSPFNSLKKRAAGTEATTSTIVAVYATSAASPFVAAIAERTCLFHLFHNVHACFINCSRIMVRREENKREATKCKIQGYLRVTLQSQSLILPMLLSSIAALFFHIPLCWALVFKMKFGSAGAALSLGLSHWLNVIFLGIYVKYSSSCEKTRVSFSKDVFINIWEFFRFAVPSAVMVCLEWWSFELVILLAGKLPNPQLETSVLSILLLEPVIDNLVEQQSFDLITAAQRYCSILSIPTPNKPLCYSFFKIFFGNYDFSNRFCKLC